MFIYITNVRLAFVFPFIKCRGTVLFFSHFFKGDRWIIKNAFKHRKFSIAKSGGTVHINLGWKYYENCIDFEMPYKKVTYLYGKVMGILSL